jgi:hypothetical protein
MMFFKRGSVEFNFNISWSCVFGSWRFLSYIFYFRKENENDFGLIFLFRVCGLYFREACLLVL